MNTDPHHLKCCHSVNSEIKGMVRCTHTGATVARKKLFSTSVKYQTVLSTISILSVSGGALRNPVTVNSCFRLVICLTSYHNPDEFFYPIEILLLSVKNATECVLLLFSFFSQKDPVFFTEAENNSLPHSHEF